MIEKYLLLSEVLHLTGFDRRTLSKLIEAGVFPPPDHETELWLEREIFDWFVWYDDEPEQD